MSGIGQELPSEAVGPAVGVSIYSWICLLLSCALLWATVAHREWKSYVAFFAFFTSLSTTASIAQQLHTYLRWTSIKLDQFEYVSEHAGNPELSVAGASVGIDLSLFYIQYYCYNVESILVVSWCTELAYSIYHLKATGSATRYGSYIAKATAVILPIIQVSLMRTDVVQSSTIGFYFVANFIMGVSLALSTILLLAILARYVATRAAVSWHVGYADRSTVDGANAATTQNTAGTFTSSTGGVPLQQKSIYDSWLVTRFTLAFAGLSAFQFVIIAQEVSFARDTGEASSGSVVNLSHQRAIIDVVTFLPGVSGSLLAFIVFGTTKSFRDYFYRKLVPRSIRRRWRKTIRSPPVVAIPTRYPIPDTPGQSEFYELDGGESGLGPRIREVDSRSPGVSSVDFAGKGHEDELPILPIRPHR
ncbi:hypothetical protein N8I77_001203 [Diaporthe amygdali]|uniref:Uncharacterized protein n=1 Tax=Phomopsis amygdali TaxID=1214568 RepID=A0AAD9SR78_PHOAM|nr:hypothetical protein N8I77_001203 [Diaporthe amygdali]